LNEDEAISMLRFLRSKRVLFIIVTAGLLLVIALWLRSAPDRRLRTEAEESPLSCALYAAKKSSHYNSEMICKVAVAFAESGDFNRAKLIINDVKEADYFIFRPPGWRFHFSEHLDFNLVDKAKALAAVAGIYSRVGRKDKALETLSQALQIEGRIENVYGSSGALTEIISKYAELGEDGQALKIIESVKPERFSDRPEALAPFRAGLLLKLADKYLGVGRIDEAFGTLERAKQTIDAIKDTSLKSNALAELGTIYAKAGQSSKADELLSDALKVITAATSQSEPNKSMALTTVAEEYAKSGFCQRAYEVSNTIAVEHNRTDALKRAGAICSKEGYTEILTYIPPEPEIEAALKLIETGEREKGLQAIQNFGRQSVSSRTLFSSGHILADAAIKLAQDRKYDLALEVTRAIVTDGQIFDDGGTIPSHEFRAEAVAEIARLYARAGPKEEGERRKFLRQALALIE
jgi:tetratricopeptide (TPR) repeat protein